MGIARYKPAMPDAKIPPGFIRYAAYAHTGMSLAGFS